SHSGVGGRMHHLSGNATLATLADPRRLARHSRMARRPTILPLVFALATASASIACGEGTSGAGGAGGKGGAAPVPVIEPSLFDCTRASDPVRCNLFNVASTT